MAAFFKRFAWLFLWSFQLCALTTKGAQIVDSSGEPVYLRGAAWPGFQNGTTMAEVSWNDPESIASDFATLVHRMKLLGFNAVRLPFSFKDLFELEPDAVANSFSPSPLPALQESVTNPQFPLARGLEIPAFHPPGAGNSYIPSGTTFERFLWVVRYFAENGFYVLLDNHLKEDRTALDDPQGWVVKWTRLVSAVIADPASKEKAIAGLLNDPDFLKVRWEETNGLPALKDLYLSAMDALHSIHPGLLFFIQGAGQNKDGGFATDSKLISKYKLSDPSSFFEALLAKPYADQVVLAPRIYFPTAPKMPQDFRGSTLWSRFSTSFGYLTSKGFQGKLFPVALDEFGSHLSDETDAGMMADLAAYLNNTGDAADGRHEAIQNWFWGNWIPDASSRAAGILASDWTHVEWKAVDYLGSLGLKPWYLTETPRIGQLRLTLLPSAGLDPQMLKGLLIEGQMHPISFGMPLFVDLPPGSYTVSLPSLASKTTEFPALQKTATVEAGQTTDLSLSYTAVALPPPPPLFAEVRLGKSSLKNGLYHTPVEILFTNNTSSKIWEYWMVSFTNPSYVSISNFENMRQASFKSGKLSAKVPQTLEAHGGNTVRISFTAISRTLDAKPQAITINSKPCKF